MFDLFQIRSRFTMRFLFMTVGAVLLVSFSGCNKKEHTGCAGVSPDFCFAGGCR